MSNIKCLANDCEIHLKRGRHACVQHWLALDPDLQRRLSSAKDASTMGSLRIEAAEFLQSRMIGKHQRTYCKSCRATIIYLPTKSGKWNPVNAADEDNFDPESVLFDPTKHWSHFATCKNAAKHRRR